LRVWRDWLADAAAHKCPGDDILWADSKKTVGLRVRIEEREAVPVGPPFRVGEERDVSYCLFYEGVFHQLWRNFEMRRLMMNRVTGQNNETSAHG
jgi:hypothetical protein